MIVSAAINVNGKIFTGRNHAEIINGNVDCRHCGGAKQGFVDDNGLFLSRAAAYDVAVDCGQIEHDGGSRCLYSEMFPKGYLKEINV